MGQMEKVVRCLYSQFQLAVEPRLRTHGFTGKGVIHARKTSGAHS